VLRPAWRSAQHVTPIEKCATLDETVLALFRMAVLVCAVLAGGTLPREAQRRPWPPPPRVQPPRDLTALRGRVLVRGPVADLPVAYARVELLRAGRSVASAATDRQGSFRFTQDLPSGPYELVVADNDYDGRLTVTVGDGRSDVVVLARRRAPTKVADSPPPAP
jgi:hypothetical protein